MRHRSLLVLAVALPALFADAGVARAHEERVFSGLDAEVGWLTEPPTTGVLNAVFVNAARDGKPATDLKLVVEVAFAGTTSPKLDLEPSDEDPGVYTAAFIPTRPGDYSFHLTGTAGRARVDQTFDPGKGVEEVGDATELQFPPGDPPVSQLADRATRLDSRVGAVKESADSAKTVGLVGLIVGGVGLFVAIVALARRRKPAAG